MAALDFPASPSNGQTYTGPGGVVWIWDGSKWVTQGIGGGFYLPIAGGTMTGPLQLVPGSVSAAALRFDPTANTGLYGAAGSVSVATSGTARLTVNDTGVLSTVPITLPGAPTLPLNAATKGYVDGFLPLTGGTLTGAIQISPPVAEAALFLNKPTVANNAIIHGQKAGLGRWDVNLGEGTAETGGNTGSNFSISRYNDAGSFVDSPLTIRRSNGYVQIAGLLEINGLAFASSTGGAGTENVIFDRSSQNAILLGSAAVSIPNHDLSLTKPAGGYAVITHTVSGQRMWTLGEWPDGTWTQYDNGASAVRILIDLGGNCKNTTGTWSAVSDAELKTEIADYPRGLADLVKLQPRSFRYTGAYDDGALHQGFVAQEMEPHFPELIGEMDIAGPVPDPDNEGKTLPHAPRIVKTVDPTATIYAVVNALKEINARLATLEGGTPAP